MSERVSENLPAAIKAVEPDQLAALKQEGVVPEEGAGQVIVRDLPPDGRGKIAHNAELLRQREVIKLKQKVSAAINRILVDAYNARSGKIRAIAAGWESEYSEEVVTAICEKDGSEGAWAVVDALRQTLVSEYVKGCEFMANKLVRGYKVREMPQAYRNLVELPKDNNLSVKEYYELTIAAVHALTTRLDEADKEYKDKKEEELRYEWGGPKLTIEQQLARKRERTPGANSATSSGKGGGGQKYGGGTSRKALQKQRDRARRGGAR